MKGYRNAIKILICLIVVVCVATVGFSVVQYNYNRNITVTYGPPTQEKDQFPINVNTATKEQMMLLPGIGEVKAEAIIRYRDEIGGFTSAEQLLNVSGIGQKTLDGIKEYICF